MIEADHSNQVRGTNANTAVFENIADALIQQGYCVLPEALPSSMVDLLRKEVLSLHQADFHEAGVGRTSLLKNDKSVRRDQISWIDRDTCGGKLWLDWAEQLMLFLNRRLFLGLFSFESHFAHYREGDFYQKHLDAFKGNTNRTLSLVTYLNPQWQTKDGGELVLFEPDSDREITRVLPTSGTLVIFLSEEFPHQVLPAKRERYSIAGWFRVNS